MLLYGVCVACVVCLCVIYVFACFACGVWCGDVEFVSRLKKVRLRVLLVSLLV